MKIQYMEKNELKTVECDEAKNMLSEFRLKKDNKEILRIPIKDIDKVIGPKRTNCDYCERPEVRSAQKNIELQKTISAIQQENSDLHSTLDFKDGINKMLRVSLKKMTYYAIFLLFLSGTLGVLFGLIIFP